MHTGKTFTAEVQKDRTTKGLKLTIMIVPNNGPTLFPISPPTGNKAKPTIRIKRLKRDDPIKMLKGTSAIQKNLKSEREKMEKALKLNSLI